LGRFGTHLIVQLVLALVVAGVAGFTALILSGALGGVAMGVAPEPTFGLVAGVICPQGSSLRFYSVTRSFHRPGESEPHLECVGPGDENKDVLLQGILAVLGLSFAATFVTVFVPIHVPLSLLAFFATNKFASASDGVVPEVRAERSGR
jgi:hypothetical protein